jgi:ribosome biogenesis GTPase
LAEGSLEPSRLESYRKLQREVAYQVRLKDKREALLHKERWKKLISQHRKGYRKR